ncbi:unnamed protein product [Mucor hiemalis]
MMKDILIEDSAIGPDAGFSILNEHLRIFNKVEARNTQLKRIYDQAKVQASGESALLNEVAEQIFESKDEREEDRRRSKRRKYVLDISEVQSSKHLVEKKLDSKLSIKDRLSLSHIKMAQNIVPLDAYVLNENVHTMIKEWQCAINEEKDTFIPSLMPTDKQEFCIYVMLSSIFLSTKHSIRASEDIKYRYAQSEIDYIVKHVSSILQNIFAMDDRLSIDWDTTSFAVKEIPRGYSSFRPDCIIITYKGEEVGTAEIKPLGTSKNLVDTDVCKIAEICKRKLHLRMEAAKSAKEFKTFGIMISGRQVNFSSLKFDVATNEYVFV